MADRVFRGDRTIDGVEVTVDGSTLDPHLELKTYTDHGFDWSYEGDSPRQLAHAILIEHLGDHARAQKLTEEFMLRVVAYFNNEWVMTTTDIDTALSNIHADS